MTQSFPSSSLRFHLLAFLFHRWFFVKFSSLELLEKALALQVTLQIAQCPIDIIAMHGNRQIGYLPSRSALLLPCLFASFDIGPTLPQAFLKLCSSFVRCNRFA